MSDLIPSTLEKDYGTAFQEEFYRSIAEIPFQHSAFQIERLILNHHSPERILRQCCLEIDGKLKALNGARFEHKKSLIQIAQKRKWIRDGKNKDGMLDEFDVQLLENEIEQEEYNLKQSEKLIKDAIIDLGIYYRVYEKLPKPTREEFEKSEVEYWKKRAVQQAERDMLSMGTVTAGNIELLAQIGINPYMLKEELAVIAIAEGKKAQRAIEASKDQSQKSIVPPSQS